MGDDPFGTILAGDRDAIARAADCVASLPVDLDLTDGILPGEPGCETTIRKSVSVTGPGTFFRRALRTLTFEPAEGGDGWSFERSDLPDLLPIRVSVHNVWTTARNIVLCSGSPHNYMRMVEHIVALRYGMGIDNLRIRVDAGDPPLFDRGSLDLVEALESAGTVVQPRAPVYVTVREPVTVGAPNGGFLTLRPCTSTRPSLSLDCAVDFPTAIGRQRLKVDLSSQTFRRGAEARTNTTHAMMLYCRTIGQLFADTRNLGYTPRNILIAGRRGYVNEAKMVHEGKSLEAVWHRTMLDLLAALSLIDCGRLVGEVISYKAGHALDVVLVRMLYKHRLLHEMSFPKLTA